MSKITKNTIAAIKTEIIKPAKLTLFDLTIFIVLVGDILIRSIINGYSIHHIQNYLPTLLSYKFFVLLSPIRVYYLLDNKVSKSVRIGVCMLYVILLYSSIYFIYQG